MKIKNVAIILLSSSIYGANLPEIVQEKNPTELNSNFSPLENNANKQLDEVSETFVDLGENNNPNHSEYASSESSSASLPNLEANLPSATASPNLEPTSFSRHSSKASSELLIEPTESNFSRNNSIAIESINAISRHNSKDSSELFVEPTESNFSRNNSIAITLTEPNLSTQNIPEESNDLFLLKAINAESSNNSSKKKDAIEPTTVEKQASEPTSLSRKPSIRSEPALGHIVKERSANVEAEGDILSQTFNSIIDVLENSTKVVENAKQTGESIKQTGNALKKTASQLSNIGTPKRKPNAPVGVKKSGCIC